MAKDSGLFGCRTIESHISKASTHITFATKHNAQSCHRGAMRNAACVKNASLQVIDDYNELIALDPKRPMRILENTPAPFLPTQKLVWMFLTTKPAKMVKKTQDIWGTAPTRGCIWMH